MNKRKGFLRKIGYGVAIAALLFPLSLLSAPATVDSPGGTLAQMRTAGGLSQADLGEIDPASETIKLATLGLRGVAVNLLWEKANHYKKTEDWTNLTATLEQLAKLQPNYETFWKFQSWNLSYNVSVEFDDYHDRYYWVRRGIEFLQDGVAYNRDSPVLLWELGWVLGQKIGRADEKVQYRRLFKADEEYHPTDRPPVDRDNWLVSKQAYLESIAAVDEKGKSLGKKSPAVFYSSAPKSQMNYAEAIGEDGLFETSVAAWKIAEDDWRDFGNIQIEHSTGKLIRFNDEGYLAEQLERTQAELTGMIQGVEDALEADLQASLTDEEREALDTPLTERTEAQTQLVYAAQAKLRVTPDKLAAKIAEFDPERQRAASEIAARVRDVDQSLRYVRAYKDTANYDYWALRCEFEQTKDAVQARELLYRARKAFREDGDPVTAMELYEQSFERWAAVFEEFPKLKDGEDTTGDDVMFYIYEYTDVLDVLDLDIADDFPLWQIIETFDTEARFQVQVRERRIARGEDPDGDPVPPEFADDSTSGGPADETNTEPEATDADEADSTSEAATSEAAEQEEATAPAEEATEATEAIESAEAPAADGASNETAVDEPAEQAADTVEEAIDGVTDEAAEGAAASNAG